MTKYGLFINDCHMEHIKEVESNNPSTTWKLVIHHVFDHLIALPRNESIKNLKEIGVNVRKIK